MSRWIKPFEENLRIDRPKLFRKLSENGQLVSYLKQTSEMAMKACVQLSKRMDPYQAESEAVRMFLLPSEDDQPDLGESPPEEMDDLEEMDGLEDDEEEADLT